MEENWYAVEQQVRDRVTEARAAARLRALTEGLAPPARRPHSVGIAFIRLAGWVWGWATGLPSAPSRAVANVKRRESTNTLLAGKGSRP